MSKLKENETFQSLIDGLLKDEDNNPIEKVVSKNGLILINLSGLQNETLERCFSIFNGKTWYLVHIDTENLIDNITIDSNATRLGIKLITSDSDPSYKIELASGLVDSQKEINISDGSKIIIATTDVGTLYYFVDAMGNEGFKAIEVVKGQLQFNGSQAGRNVIQRYFEFLYNNPIEIFNGIDENGKTITF